MPSVSSEVKLPEDKIRSLIIWGLSHDYKRVLRTLRGTAKDIIKSKELERNHEIQFVYTKYSNRCDEIENFLDEMGNTLDKRKNEDITPLLESQTKTIDDLISRLIACSEKISGIVDSQVPAQAAAKQMAAILTRQTRRAQQQMLALWSMPFGKLETRPIAFRVKKEIWRVLSDLSSVFLAHGCSIRDNVDVNSSHILKTDRTLFSVAVSNIVANAVIHSGQGKNLKITIREAIETDTELNKTFLSLSISDNGPGIPADEQEAVFVLFRQGSQSLASETGSGVGLTFAQLAMDLVGGTLVLSSTPGRGAAFVLKFPV